MLTMTNAEVFGDLVDGNGFPEEDVAELLEMAKDVPGTFQIPLLHPAIAFMALLTFVPTDDGTPGVAGIRYLDEVS